MMHQVVPKPRPQPGDAPQKGQTGQIMRPNTAASSEPAYMGGGPQQVPEQIQQFPQDPRRRTKTTVIGRSQFPHFGLLHLMFRDLLWLRLNIFVIVMLVLVHCILRVWVVALAAMQC